MWFIREGFSCLNWQMILGLRRPVWWMTNETWPASSSKQHWLSLHLEVIILSFEVSISHQSVEWAITLGCCNRACLFCQNSFKTTPIVHNNENLNPLFRGAPRYFAERRGEFYYLTFLKRNLILKEDSNPLSSVGCTPTIFQTGI